MIYNLEQLAPKTYRARSLYLTDLVYTPFDVLQLCETRCRLRLSAWSGVLCSLDDYSGSELRLLPYISHMQLQLMEKRKRIIFSMSKRPPIHI